MRSGRVSYWHTRSRDDFPFIPPSTKPKLCSTEEVAQFTLKCVYVLNKELLVSNFFIILYSYFACTQVSYFMLVRASVGLIVDRMINAQ